MPRNPCARFLAWLVCAASAGPLACSTPSKPTPAGGGSAGQAGSSTAQGGTSAQAGTSALGGATAQGGSVALGGATAQAGASMGGSAASGTGGAGGAGAVSSPDVCKTALYCDDFEMYNAGAPPGGAWSVNMNGGAVAVDTTHAHSGTRAAKISANQASGYRSAMISLQNTKFLPTASNVVYGRMMFWLDSAPQMSVHWTFIDGQGKVPGQAYHALYRYGGQQPISDGNTFVGSQLMANYDTPDSYSTPPVGPSSDCWLQSNKKVVPVAVWSCAEWKFDGAASKMQFWLDGAEVPDLAMNGTGQGCVNQPATFPWTAPSIERLDVGWESYQADDARTIWIDDVAISTERVGCPAP